jgi:hypothetical protein
MAHRTALIAAGSIAIVIVGGAVAVAANLGILDAADSHSVGTLSAAAPAASTMPEPAPTASPAPIPQEYLIKRAGSVSVVADKTGLHMSDVTARHGWTWALAQTKRSTFTVTFTSGSVTYRFVAALSRNGAILARVDRPVTKVVTVRSAPVLTASRPVAPVVPPRPAAASTPTHQATATHSESSDDGGSHADD